MTAIAALTLLDGQSTPASHTFNPINIDADGVARWADRSGGVAIGFPVVSMSMKAPSAKGSRNYRMVGKVTLPILEQTSPSTATGIQPAPTVAYNLIANIEFVLPERSTLAQRNDIAAYAKNFLANGVVQAALQNFEYVY